MSELKDNYQNLTTEELLKRRALGEDGLSMQAHKVIEDILNERNVVAPPIPTKQINQSELKNSGNGKSLPTLLILVLFLLLAVLGKVIALSLKGTAVGVGIVVLMLVYLIYKKISYANKTEEQKLDDKLVNSEEGFTELMYCSVKGDIKRAIELIDYGVDVNAQDLKGTTALMYAISNNHTNMVQFLLANGANAKLKTDKGNTAQYFANKYGNNEIKKMLA